MEGFFWLITQMTLLLMASAVIFFWLGWRWRGQDSGREISALRAQMESADSTSRRESDECGLSTADEALHARQAKTEADLQEANDHRRNLERELIRVHDDLKAARRDAIQRAEDASAAKAAVEPLQKEVSRLSADLEVLKRDKEQVEKKLSEQLVRLSLSTSEAVEVVSVPCSAETGKPKRVRKAADEPKPKAARTTKPIMDAQVTLDRLAAELSTKQALLTALHQEYDAWQRRVAVLREKGKDPAGLGLAQKSLVRAEADLSLASRAVEHLLHRQCALKQSLEQATTITESDDLTKIKGIKAVLQDQLHAFGIRTFRQIAAWTDEDVEAFSELLSFKDRAKRDQWVKQAHELMQK